MPFRREHIVTHKSINLITLFHTELFLEIKEKEDELEDGKERDGKK